MSQIVMRKSLVRAVAWALPVLGLGCIGAANAAVLVPLESHVEDAANPATYLAGTKTAVMTQDGKFVYVGASGDNAVTAYSRDAATGALTKVAEYAAFRLDQNITYRYLGGTSRLALSPDGMYLVTSGYLYGGNSPPLLNTFLRDPETGNLSFQMHATATSFGFVGVRMAFAEDNKNLYLVSERAKGVSIFALVDNGHMYSALPPYEASDTTPAAAAELSNPTDIAVSADGASVYVIGRNATNTSGDLVVLARNATDGTLTASESHKQGEAGVTGLDDPRAVAVSADGKHVYVASMGAIGVFSRAAEGTLTFVAATNYVIDQADVLAGAQALSITPDGKTVYVGTSGKTLTALTRDANSGALTVAGHLADGVADIALGEVRQIAMSADGAHLYTASGGNVDGVSVFSAAADVSVVAQANINSVALSSAYNFTLTVTNDGPSDAADVLVEIVPPNGVTVSTVAGPDGVECEAEADTSNWHCHLGTLVDGASLLLSADATAPVATGTIVTTAEVMAANADTLTDNNQAELSLAVSDVASGGPENPSSDGGGGGALHFVWLLGCGIAGAARLRKRVKK